MHNVAHKNVDPTFLVSGNSSLKASFKGGRHNERESDRERERETVAGAERDRENVRLSQMLSQREGRVGFVLFSSFDKFTAL